ncbi:MAG: DUF1361 domain-containing protein [Saprospiraceae bacterium]|nr:DUF1361 domain-containing protein [Saprospiraceae bacterium]
MLKSLFQTEKQYRIFKLLCLTTLLNFALVAGRLWHTGFDFSQINEFYDLAMTRSNTFLFLIWNLFLAWIPYTLSLIIPRVPSRWIALPLLLIWLVFLPNAPYIITDLLHIHYRAGVPLWYDVMMIFSFAWTGLLLGFISLLDVQSYLDKLLGEKNAAIIIWAVIGLCAFGVYLGRYQRWNTWDLLLEPYQLFWDVLGVLFHPIANMGTLGLAAVMAGVLGLGYTTLKTLVRE